MITRQILYSALPAPTTAAFAIVFSIYRSNCSPTSDGSSALPAQPALEKKTQPRTLPPVRKNRQPQGQFPIAASPPWSGLYPLQNCTHRQFGSGQNREFPLPLGKPRYGECDHMRPRRELNLGWRAAHVLAVKRDFGARRRRTEIAPNFLQSSLRRNLLHGDSGRSCRGHRRTLPGCRYVRNWMSCNCGRTRLRTGLSVRIYQRVQLTSRLAFVIHVVHGNAALHSSGVETFAIGQRRALGKS